MTELRNRGLRRRKVFCASKPARRHRRPSRRLEPLRRTVPPWRASECRRGQDPQIEPELPPSVRRARCCQAPAARPSWTVRQVGNMEALVAGLMLRPLGQPGGPLARPKVGSVWRREEGMLWRRRCRCRFLHGSIWSTTRSHRSAVASTRFESHPMRRLSGRRSPGSAAPYSAGSLPRSPHPIVVAGRAPSMALALARAGVAVRVLPLIRSTRGAAKGVTLMRRFEGLRAMARADGSVRVLVMASFSEAAPGGCQAYFRQGPRPVCGSVECLQIRTRHSKWHLSPRSMP